MPIKKLKGADHIYERFSVDGHLTSYQVKIRRKGFPNHSGSFDNLDDAKRFVFQKSAIKRHFRSQAESQ